MDLDFIVAIIGALAGITSIVASFKKTSDKEKLKDLEKDLDESIHILSKEIPEKEIEEFKQKVHNAHINKSEGGFVEKNFLLYFVPGCIALALFALYIFLIATNDSSYVAPESLTSFLKIITGFLFGALATKIN